MTTFSVEYRPTKRTKDRPWVILMDAHPKPITVARVATEADARDAADSLTLSASVLDGFE